jgi:hypothetical protein
MMAKGNHVSGKMLKNKWERLEVGLGVPKNKSTPLQQLTMGTRCETGMLWRLW